MMFPYLEFAPEYRLGLLNSILRNLLKLFYYRWTVTCTLINGWELTLFYRQFNKKCSTSQRNTTLAHNSEIFLLQEISWMEHITVDGVCRILTSSTITIKVFFFFFFFFQLLTLLGFPAPYNRVRPFSK